MASRPLQRAGVKPHRRDDGEAEAEKNEIEHDASPGEAEAFGMRSDRGDPRQVSIPNVRGRHKEIIRERRLGSDAALLPCCAKVVCILSAIYTRYPGRMTRPASPLFHTTNWRAHNAALRRRESLTIWFDPQTAWLAAPTGKRDRQPVFSDAAIQTCLMLKALFGCRKLSGVDAALSWLGARGGAGDRRHDPQRPRREAQATRQGRLEGPPFRGLADHPGGQLVSALPIELSGA